MIHPPPPGFRLEPLGKHDRAGFSCGQPALDRYLRVQAGQDMRRFLAATFVLVDEAASAVAGYYSLAATAVELDRVPEQLARKRPPYNVLPATLLGRLAVDRRYHGRGLGAWLLMDACARSLLQSSRIASVALIVDAIDEEAVRFYRHFDFIPLPDAPTRLLLPMQVIARLFERP